MDIRDVRAFPSPEQQLNMMKKSINGVNISDVLEARVPNVVAEQTIPSQNYEETRLRNIDRMVQAGELVHKSQIPQYGYNPQQTQVVNNQQVAGLASGSTTANDENKLLDELFGVKRDDNALDVANTGNQYNNALQNNVPVPQQQQTQQALSDYETALNSQINIFSQEATKRGHNPKDVIDFVSQLTPEDYINLLEAERGMRPVPTATRSFGPTIGNAGNSNANTRGGYNPPPLNINDVLI